MTKSLSGDGGPSATEKGAGTMVAASRRSGGCSSLIVAASRKTASACWSWRLSPSPSPMAPIAASWARLVSSKLLASLARTAAAVPRAGVGRSTHAFLLRSRSGRSNAGRAVGWGACRPTPPSPERPTAVPDLGARGPRQEPTSAIVTVANAKWRRKIWELTGMTWSRRPDMRRGWSWAPCHPRTPPRGMR